MGEEAGLEFSVESEGPGRAEELAQKFEEFFRLVYWDEIQKLGAKYPKERGLVVDFRKLEEYDYQLADELLDNPDLYMEAMEAALARIEIPGLEEEFRPYVHISNIPQDRVLLIREITSDYIGKVVGVEGVVRKATVVEPKLKVAVWACRYCGRTYSIVQDGIKLKKPFVCVCGKKDFELLPDQSAWTDFQRIEIQEPLEYLRGGEQAQSIVVHLEGDLVNRVAPGDRVIIVGVLRLRQPDGRKTVYGKYIDALYIEPVQKEFEELEPSDEEIKRIKELAKDPNIYEKLVRSIAPSIKGHEKIKEAIALQLFGGVKKKLPDGTQIRGNIHILLMGDPGTGKSQILQYVTKIAPKSFYVAGKTASGAGLTASAEKDELGEGGWVLKAGVLVLASGGLAAIDEFEKIDPKDRAALHEAMEQQSYPEDFEIMLADGRKVKIGELVDQLMEANRDRVVKGVRTEFLDVDGIYIVGYDREKRRAVVAKVTRVSRHELPDHFVRILAGNGREITVTPEHPVLVWREGIREVPAEELRPGDLLVGVREIPIREKDVDKDLARFLGYFLSEGFAYERKGYWEVGVSNTDRKLIEDVERLLKAFGAKPTVQVSTKGRKKPLYTVRVVSKEFYHWLKGLAPEAFERGEGRPSLHKRVPALIMGADKKARIEFLRAFFRGDGFIDSLRVGFITASRTMAEDLQDLLLSLGIYSYIATERREKGTYYKVIVSGGESLERFMKIVAGDEREERVRELLRKARRKRMARDYLPVDVVRRLNRVLLLLRSSDGAFWEERPVNREYAAEYVKKARSALEELKRRVESGDVTAARRIVPLAEIARDWGVPHSTLRYRGGWEEEVLKRARKRLEEAERLLEEVEAFVFGNIRLVPVKGVERIQTYGRWVYDVTVEPLSLFVSHGLVLHNSISIAKAGIVTRFKAETSILAAANPKFGRFDPYENPLSQINIEPTILSRFDLMFIVKEVLDENRDRAIAEHILKTHKAGEMRMQYERGVETSLTVEEVEAAEAHIRPEIDPDLLRKYVAYARTHVFPVLSDEAMKEIVDFYVNLRKMGKQAGTVPTTARQLEALIRLAEAAARVQLSNVVTAEHARRAIELFKASMEEVLKDKETGVFDYDILTTGQTKSVREKMKIVLNIIRHYTAEYDAVAEDDVVEEAKQYGIEPEKAREIIEKLKRQGEIYEPKPGYLRPSSME